MHTKESQDVNKCSLRENLLWKHVNYLSEVTKKCVEAGWSESYYSPDSYWHSDFKECLDALLETDGIQVS